MVVTINIYFTSDTHFHHKNILNFENRPYKTVEEMNEDLIERWNSQVNDDDIVYHLGDLCLSSFENTVNILKQLKGKIILIKGNHDHSQKFTRINKMGLLHEYHEVGKVIKYKKQIIYLTHFPLEIGFRPRYWSVHGHIHSHESNWLNQINVGVDSPHFKHKPFGELVTIDELFKIMMERLPLIEEEFLKIRNMV